MTPPPDEHGNYDELDLGQILRELYRRKWLILFATILAGAAGAAYSLTKPNIYESSAALIIREPQRAIERSSDSSVQQDMTTLSVETLQILTESTEITYALFDKLIESGDIIENGGDKQNLFRSFQKSLSTELKKQQARSSSSSVQILPVLVLKSKAIAPEKSQAIANEWAKLVEAKSRELYTEGVTALDEYIGGIYLESNKSLELAEQELADKTLEASLTLKDARLVTLSKKLSELEDGLYDLDIELAVNEASIAEGEARIDEQRFDENWIGSVAEDALLRGEPFPFSEESLSEKTQRLLTLTKTKVQQTESLRKFRRESNLLDKEKKFEHYQLDMERILENKAETIDELPTAETALAALTKELENIPERLVLDKAITDDALWNLHVKDPAAVAKLNTPLKTEIVNPLYQSTRQQIVELSTKVETLRTAKSQFEQTESAVSGNYELLESEIDAIKEELERRETALEATQTSIAFHRDGYLEETKLVEELRRDNLRNHSEKTTKQELLETLTAEAHELEADLSENELAIESLARKTENSKKVRIALAAKAEEFALLKLSAEKASRTGTVILHNAQANPDKIGPARSKSVLMTMGTALVACCFIVCIAKLLREAE